MSNHTEPSPLREATIDALSDLTEEFGRLLDDGARQLSLTSVRCEVIFVLHRHGAQRQRQVAELLGISPQQSAVLVDALVERDLVTRTPDPTDRRAVLVELTPAGERIAHQITHMRTRTADRLLDRLADEEVETLSGLISHLLQRLREPRG